MSAGWMYRLVVESLLGLRLETDRLYVTLCLPAHWHGVTIYCRYRETVHHIAIVQTDRRWRGSTWRRDARWRRVGRTGHSPG
jgi:cellobiose phosphorylase